MKLPPDQTEALLATERVGDFLKIWIQKNAATLTLAEVTERFGLKSRGFLHDLLNHRRGMTLETYNKVVRAMGISAHLKRHLRILSEIDDAGYEQKRKLQDALTRNRSKARKVLSSTDHPDIPALKDWDRVYAASGSLEAGATLQEISKRAKLPLERVREISEILVTKGLFKKEAEDRVRPLSLYGSFNASDGNEKIPNYLLEAVDEIRENCRKSLQTGTSVHLYRNLVFSIQSRRYPEFRERLRTLMEEFANAAEEPAGDGVARAFFSFEILD